MVDVAADLRASKNGSAISKVVFDPDALLTLPQPARLDRSFRLGKTARMSWEMA
ncbi:hypothetical protein ACOI1H_23440 [Loktanella sp. DJP18]|uniref:hypothetical protein n=1 Tax=Loktanella sp. DJP18 TaxID=3409788 RepID=UPI003BB6CB1B